MSDNWYTDYAQNRRIRGLEEDLSHVSSSLASARSSQRRLHAELSKVRGSLEQRLDRLSAAFDAFVEISDLRVTLGLFDAQGRIRHRARQLVAGQAGAEPLSDVDGYWLAPALVALGAAVDGVADAGSLGLARERDALRATVYHVLGTGLLGGRETCPGGMLADALPVLGATVPLYQRAVWTLGADGLFGEAGWELVRRRVTEFAGGPAGETEAGTVAAVRRIGTARAASAGLPRQFEKAGELAAVLDAGARLAALRVWVQETLAWRADEPVCEVDPLVRECFDLLVEEGSPAELPLLARERELRAVIESTGGEPAAWDGPAGETLALIHADLADGEHPGRRAVAVRSCAAHVLTVAEQLAGIARRPFPATVQVRTRLGLVTITGRGAESLEAVHRRIEVSSRVSGERRATACGTAAGAVVFLVLAIAFGWGWLLVAAGAGGVAGLLWRKDGQERAAAVEKAARDRAEVAGEIGRRVATFAEWRSKLAEQQSSIDKDLAALHAALD